MIAQLCSPTTSRLNVAHSHRSPAAHSRKPNAAVRAGARHHDAVLPQRSGCVASAELRSSRRSSVVVKAAFSPPTVADTKKKFIDAYQRPIPSIYNTVVQELLVQQHFIRYSINYKYNAVYALGFVSVFDQILDGFDAAEKEKIFKAYVEALGEDPKKYRADAEKLESQARELSGPDGLQPDASGNDLTRALAEVAAANEAGKFAYNRFFAVGLFRLLELTGAKEPAALEKLVKAVGVKPAAVNKDLLMYKGVLSKLSAAKEMMREFLDREKRKQAEREAAKAEQSAAQQLLSETA